MADQPNPRTKKLPNYLPDFKAIDLALSGGGFRATLFHLGLIGFLRDLDVLERVKTICSVSGGSILAAHLVTYWDDYVGTQPEAFRKRVKQLVGWIISNDVSGEVLSQSQNRVLSFQTLDSMNLVAQYQRLFDVDKPKIRRWDDLDSFPNRPELHLVATHLNTGQAGAYSRNGFRIAPVSKAHGPRADEINALAALAEKANVGHQEIARAVAASSAFPPIFSPIPLVDGEAEQLHLLTDGGVYDNSGVNWLRSLYESKHWTDAKDRMVIVSDAGREFPTKLGPQYEKILALAMRVTDTQANRIAKSDSSAAENFFKSRHCQVLRLSIHEPIAHYPTRPDAHSDRVQELLATIRTELDNFSKEEVLALYVHGYLSAQTAWARWHDTFTELKYELEGVPWTPVELAIDRIELEKRLHNSHEVKKLNGIFATVLFWLARKYGVWALLIAASLAGGGYYLGSRSKVAALGEATGPIGVSRSDPYRIDGWAASIPTLAPVLRSADPQYIYTVETLPIGSLTGGKPHAAANVTFALTGPLTSAKVFLILGREVSPREVQYVLLTEVSPGTLLVPSGGANDRLLGLVVSPTEITDRENSLRQHLSISLETP